MKNINTLNMKKICTNDWMILQPYSPSDEVDIYYVKVANRIASILKVLSDDNVFSESNIRNIAIYLTSWFQDIVSETGIWKTFTDECKKRYGYPVPFMQPEKENEYYAGEVNLDDVRFLLWHYCQCLKRNSGGILNPENPAFEEMAYQIYDYLFDEYETAPANERLYNLFYGETFGKDDFYKFRELLEWFHFCSYIGFENPAEYQHLSQELYRTNPNKDLNLNLLLYGLKQYVIQEGRNNLLSLTSVEWLARLGKQHPETTAWADGKSYPRGSFLYEGEDENYLIVRDLLEKEKEPLHIRKDSLNMDSLKGIKKEETIIECSLIYYGEAWWQSGTLITSDYNEQAKQMIEERLENQKQPQMAYTAFMEASEGKQFVFCSSSKEAQEFLTQKMKFTFNKAISLPEQKEENGILLMASPRTGIHLQTAFCDCIYAPENTLYDKEQAKQKAVFLMLSANAIPYDLSCTLQDQGMLPDARLNSMKGEAHGQELIQKYGSFLTDYFFRQCREKDLY